MKSVICSSLEGNVRNNTKWNKVDTDKTECSPLDVQPRKVDFTEVKVTIVATRGRKEWGGGAKECQKAGAK